MEIEMTVLKKFWNDDSGATAIEYGLIAALVSVMAIAALSSSGENLSGTFTNVSGELQKGSGQ
jgi:pilus assembly protein Flp/PilA